MLGAITVACTIVLLGVHDANDIAHGPIFNRFANCNQRQAGDHLDHLHRLAFVDYDRVSQIGPGNRDVRRDVAFGSHADQIFN